MTRLITSDDHAGLRAARRAVFPNVPWQGCQFHLQQNAQAYVPQVTLRPRLTRDLRSVFNAGDGTEAKERIAKLVETYRTRLRTVNALERLNAELHRRTRVATLFPSEASPPARLGHGRRDQRRMQDRTWLADPGERVTRHLSSYREEVAQSPC